jgi:AraC-like DNA-binding protein
MASDPQNFKKRHFKSPDAVDRNWLEWFREEFGRQLYNIEFEPNPDAPFKMEATSRTLPDLALSQSSRSPMRTAHRGNLDDNLSMLVIQAGDILLRFGDTDVALAANMATLGRNDVKAILDIRSNTEMLSIRLRRQILEPLVKDLSNLRDVAVVRNAQAVRLLAGYVRMLDQEEMVETPEAKHLITMHVHDLAALAFGATADAKAIAEGRGVRAARLAAIKSDILSRLSRPDLSAAAVAARQGVTPRYVYALLEMEGLTFSEYVVAQRLALAHRMLSDPRFRGEPINSIAFAVGFSDISYFNRTFRRRYGATPSDVREAASREN